MNKNLTDLTLVVDRSGSMASCRQEAQSGINHLIKTQKEAAGDAILTLVQFDTKYEFVYNGRPIKEVGEYLLVPRGNTALLDAIGRAINETGRRIEAIPEDKRPGLVIFGITTDGADNSSHEFTKAKIKEMIEHQTTKYGWQFTFLGANQDAFIEAAGIGISVSATANFSQENADFAYLSMSNNISRMRSASMRGENIVSSYTEDERNKMKK